LKEDKKLFCTPEGDCDNPLYRNVYDGKQLEIGLNIFILCSAAGSCNGITVERVTAMLETVTKDYSIMKITYFVNEIRFVVDARYATISAYTPLNSQWYTDIINVKNLYGEQPDKFLNVFATAQTASIYGTLLGIGTFPWDPASGQKTGGLWLNAITVRGADYTFAHEVGHNVGLWHTFHGDSEVTRCGDCYEFVHAETDDKSWPNTVGDFCADTPAQPNNQNCANPTSVDCEGNRWDKFGQNLINNIMAYTINANGRAGCNNVFTNQQRTRSHCWVCNSLYVKGWVPPAVCSLQK